MAVSRAANRDYLEKHGNKWRVVVPVPEKARTVIGKTKLRKALNTDSLTVANRLKWSIITQFQRQIDLALAPEDHTEKALYLAQQRQDVIASGGDPEPEELEIDDLINEIAGPAIGTDTDGLPLHEPKRYEAALAFANVAYGRRTPLDASRERYLKQLKVAARTLADDNRAFGYLIDWCKAEGVPAFRETFGQREAVRFQDAFENMGDRHPRTLNKYMVRLSMYWKWMLKRGEVATNVWEGLTYAVEQETDETEERPFTEGELIKLLAGPAVQHMHDIIRIGALTGARLEVIASLTVGDCMDENIKFTTTLAERPEGKRLYDKLRHGDVLVVRWVDRLGRNYQDVTDSIRHFMRQGVIVRTVINNMTFDGATTDPIQMAVRDALIGFMAATAQAQAEATKEAQKAGIASTRNKEPEKYRGRKPSFTRDQLDAMRDMLAAGAGASAIAKATGLTRPTVQRLRDDMAGAEAVLAKWETT